MSVSGIWEGARHSVEFKPSGRGKAQCAPNPNYPHGVELDCTRGRRPACKADLPYPAPECGAWIVRCQLCGMSVAVTAAGRVDDPTSVTMPCDFKSDQPK